MARENCFYQDIFNYIVHGNTHPGATSSEKSELLKEAIQYTVIQGNLYRTFPSACKKLHLVLSNQANQKNAIFENHVINDKHLSIKETCLNVRKKYHWRNMDSDIIDFIKQCPECNENKSSVPIKTKIQQYEYLDRAWKLVEIMVIGPLLYQNSKVYLFRLADVFSKWICFHKLNDLDPKVISKILLKEFSVMGFPVGIRLVGLENSEEIIGLFENEIKEFIEKTKEVNKLFDGSNLPNSTDINSHENEIDESPKDNSNCSDSPVSEEPAVCPVEENGNNDNKDKMDVDTSEKTEESETKTEEIKPTDEENDINKESLSDLINTIPNGSEPELENKSSETTLKSETEIQETESPETENKELEDQETVCEEAKAKENENQEIFQKIKENDDFLIKKLNDFELFIENQDDSNKPLIYIFIGENSVIDSETENLYKEKLEKFITHFPDLWLEYLPSFILNIQSSVSNSFQVPSQIMFHREPHLLGLFESSRLNNLIQFPDSSIENQAVGNNIANGSHKHSSTSRKIKRYSLRQSPKPNESLGFFSDYIRTSPVKRTARSFYGNKKDFPPIKSRKLASKKEIINALVEKYSLKDTVVVLQPLPSKVVESALAGNVKVANPVLGTERETPAEKPVPPRPEPNGLSLPSSSKEENSEETNEANKENNGNHTQHEQEVVR